MTRTTEIIKEAIRKNKGRSKKSGYSLEDLYADIPYRVRNAANAVQKTQNEIEDLNPENERDQRLMLVVTDSINKLEQLNKLLVKADSIAQDIWKVSGKLGNIKEEIEEISEASSAMRDWVIDQVENTKNSHGAIQKAFSKKFGKQHAAYFEKVVDSLL